MDWLSRKSLNFESVRRDQAYELSSDIDDLMMVLLKRVDMVEQTMVQFKLL